MNPISQSALWRLSKSDIVRPRIAYWILLLSVAQVATPASLLSEHGLEGQKLRCCAMLEGSISFRSEKRKVSSSILAFSILLDVPPERLDPSAPL